MIRTKFNEKVGLDAELDYPHTSENYHIDKNKEDLEKGGWHIGRHIIAGIIVNDEFCEWAVENFPAKYLEVRIAILVASWVYEYYYKYNKAPGSDIQQIYFQKVEEGLPKDVGELIEEHLLPGLSEEYVEKGINIQYLKDRAAGYLKKRMLEEKVREVSELIESNELEEACELVKLEVPINEDLSQYFQTVDQMESEGIERPRLFMSPWLREGETNILYSDAGVGKSLLAILIGYLLGVRNYENRECDIGTWQVKSPTGTLYIDGELGKAEIMDRIHKFKWLGKQRRNMQMMILSIPDYQVKSGMDFNLSKRQTQRKIVNWLKENPKYKFLIIDSVSTVFNLENENDNSEWNKKINPFLKDLRALGVAHLIQHHAGKDSKLRGASSMSAMAHNIFRLTNDKRKEPGQAWFKVDNLGKQRVAGHLFKPFTIQFQLSNDRTEWEITKTQVEAKKSNKGEQIMAEIIQGKSSKDIMQKFDCSSAYVSQMRTKAKKKGYLDDEGVPTPKGQDLVNHHDVG